MTNSRGPAVEVLGPQRRRRWSTEEKLAIIRESYEPGKSVTLVTRRHGVNPNQLFQWRKLHQGGALSAITSGEAVVPASQFAEAMKEVQALQRLLGKKTLEVESLKEAVEYGRAKNGLRARPRC